MGEIRRADVLVAVWVCLLAVWEILAWEGFSEVAGLERYVLRKVIDSETRLSEMKAAASKV